MAKDSLKMKVYLSDFMKAQGTLQTQEGRLESILGKYTTLKSRASEFIEDDDSRCAKMQEVIEMEISKVKAQLKLVQNIQAKIDKIVEAMDSMEKSSESIINKSKETIKQGVEAIIDLKELGL
jgi:hypothetical protein